MAQETRPVVIVTGSSGLIGSAMIKRLAPRYTLIGFDRPGPPLPPPEAEDVPCDLSSDDSVRNALETVRKNHGTRLAAVVHLAAYYSFSENESPMYEKITVQGTERLLQGLRGFQVDQFQFSSTMLVHAPCRLGEQINESSPIQPKWAYPESKVKAEQRIETLRGKTPAVVLRISGIYDDHCHSIPIAHQIQRIYERQFNSHFFPGNLDHGQSFMHLDDLIDLMEAAVNKRADLPPTVALVVGESEALSTRELQSLIGVLLHGRGVFTLRIPKLVAKLGAWLQLKLGIGDGFIKPWMIDLADDHYALDITRAHSVLCWKPRHGLRGALPQMIAALKADPVRWYKENDLNGLPE